MSEPTNITGPVTIASATTSVTLFGLSMSEIGVILSAVVAVSTFALHVWYTMRKDRRERELHARRMEAVDD